MNYYLAVKVNILPAFYKATALTILGVFLFTCVDIFIKLLSPDFHVGQVLFVFGAGTAFIFWVMAFFLIQPIFDIQYFHKATILRCVCEMIGGLALVFALANSALSTVTAIMQASPFVLTIMAVIFLREKIALQRIIAIFIGFIGVLIVIRPSLAGIDIHTIAAFIGVIGLAGRDFSARILPNRVSVVGLSFFGSLSVAFAGFLVTTLSGSWTVPDIQQSIYCIAMVMAGSLGLWCMSASIRLADVSAVSPFRYTRIVFGMITGIIIFGENVDIFTALGSIIIIGAGLYSWSRERRMMGLRKPTMDNRL